jgi:hypothetical protein
MSRNDVKQLCEPAFGISIATGTIQKIIDTDRGSMALVPVYGHIGEIARSHWCNYIDETSWFMEHDLNGLNAFLTLKETCRLRSKRTYPILVNCIKSYFLNTMPDISWI